MNTENSLKILLLFTSILLISCKGRNEGENEGNNNLTMENKKIEEKVNNYPLLIKIYNKTVSYEFSLEFIERWGKWVVEEDNYSEDYNTYNEFLEESRFKIIINENNKNIYIEDTGIGGGTGTVVFTEISNNENEIVYLLLIRTLSPEWLEVDKKLVFYNKQREEITTSDKITNPETGLELFFNEDVTILKENTTLSVDLNYDTNNYLLKASLFKSYLFDCESKHAFVDFDEKMKEEICNLLVNKETEEIIFSWDNKIKLFSLKEEDPTHKLIGVWHNSPVVNTALGRTYTFFSDKTYMDRAHEGGKERERYIKGRWELLDGTVRLTPLKQGVLEGGRKDFDPLSGDSIIVGANLVEKEFQANSIELPVSDIDYIQEMYKYHMKIGEVEFFKLDNDPNADCWNEEVNEEKKTYMFLSEIKEINLPVYLNVDDKEKGLPIDTLPFHANLIETLNSISSERLLPNIELPDFSDCPSEILGKIKFDKLYMLLIKTGVCPFGNITICGILIDENRNIKGEVVLAGYSGGSGASQKLFSTITKETIQQKTIESSWSNGVTIASDTTHYVIDINLEEEQKVFNYR